MALASGASKAHHEGAKAQNAENIVQNVSETVSSLGLFGLDICLRPRPLCCSLQLLLKMRIRRKMDLRVLSVASSEICSWPSALEYCFFCKVLGPTPLPRILIEDYQEPISRP